eukprot:CAMPEP_0201281822 /NCGR_PEP_ID=MMETSP1317-20130820/4162_1 /ASSEMBLY_ACC=CAM_ASM_000770 /TAXON_ID=187299 /ORGANISM="Undescribed Undescribed, Strain Undescribed" /LENGTH=33 /DNA_ID= /DNA_START= /DNA_END= /DNA_ORIENTATION=
MSLWNNNAKDENIVLQLGQEMKRLAELGEDFQI